MKGKRGPLKGFKDGKRKATTVRIYDDELLAVNDLRRIRNEAIENGLDPADVKHGWIKNDSSSLFFKNPNFQNALAERDKLFKDLAKSMKAHSPKYPKIKRERKKEGRLLVIDIADLHINKYAEAGLTGADYNSKIAVERALSGTEGLLRKASGFSIDRILFVVGNDVLNTDNLSKSTTSNTPQDTDLNWFKAYQIAQACYVKCIELCLTVADVDVIHCPSNHDEMCGTMLADSLQVWFRYSKNITFDTSPRYRKYYQYGNSMLELEHGHKGKAQNLPLVMAQEEPQMWAATKFRYAYLHHVHHQDKTQFKSGKDYVGANVTYLRSPSSADMWHYQSQFINMVAAEAFIHSKTMGRECHLTHYF